MPDSVAVPHSGGGDPDPGSGRESGAAPEPGSDRATTGVLALAIGSIGVVYGDIGTSPLYAFREAITAAGAGTAAGATSEAVYGVLSLILWALIIIVTFKYVLLLLRADNNGEGGMLTLMALARKVRVAHERHRSETSVRETTQERKAEERAVPLLVTLGILGAALFFGDALITPAISVLSAVEGLEIAAPGLTSWVVPGTIAILLVLFALQSRGTARVATLFGPVMVVWFAAIALPGVFAMAAHPEIILALNPFSGLSFLFRHGMVGAATLGAVFLAVTGAEALYADLGHFGRTPIQSAWLGYVFPALVLNYLAQGAAVLANPSAVQNPFFLLYPERLQVPMVILATAATVIASQAVISGAYSLTRQAIALNLLPRLDIKHTSEEREGQIYIPRVNFFLLVGVIALVAAFGSSSALASAYGIAVTGTMVLTAVMAFIVVHEVWRWSLPAAIALIAPFLVVDTSFLAANLLKILQGGWVPLAIAGVMMVIMYTWQNGTRILLAKTRRETRLCDLIPKLESKLDLEQEPEQVTGKVTAGHQARQERERHKYDLKCVSGTAVFLTGDPEFAPASLLHSIKHYKVIHERNVILSIETDHRPRVRKRHRLHIEPLGKTFLRVTLRFGYMEEPDVPRALALARKTWKFDVMTTSFFVSRRKLRASPRARMPVWQDHLFIALARSAHDTTDYFRIPTNRVVEIGTQVTI